MAIYVGNNGKGDFKDVPPGTHVAVCYMLVDLGLQPSTWQGVTKYKHKLYIRFETPEERTDDGKPLSIGMYVGANLSPKGNLRPMLEAWRGRSFTEEELKRFDVTSILGKACLISVTHEQKGDKTYANIKSVAALPKGSKAPAAENALLKYGPDDRAQEAELPEWIKKKLSEAKQPDAKPAAQQPSTVDEDIPF